MKRVLFLALLCFIGITQQVHAQIIQIHTEHTPAFYLMAMLNLIVVF